MSPTPAIPPLDRTGLGQGVGAYLIWGLLPLYFAALTAVSASEVLATRIVFSLALIGVVVVLTRRAAVVQAALAQPKVVAMLALSAALISANWLTYIWAVQNHHVIEASLGYFINPLLNVVMGVAILRERLTRIQLAAIAFAAAGVAVLAGGAGDYLWISAMLALTFALYGLVRKMVAVEALEGLAIETALLTPPAVAWLLWLGAEGTLVLGADAALSVMLAAGGVLTAMPLLLFASAARRLPYSVLGLLQYVAPTLQFLVAVLWLGEALTGRHIVCFSLIWTGIALFAWGTIRPRPAIATD